ncbi:hypothetical protein VaNZ11_006707, partial [Volvox africanus]
GGVMETDEALLPATVRSLLVQGLVVNSTASLRRSQGPGTSTTGKGDVRAETSPVSLSVSALPSAGEGHGKIFQRSGSPTECALLELPYNLGWGWDWGWGPGWGFGGRGGELDGTTSGSAPAGSAASSIDGAYSPPAAAATAAPPTAASQLSGGTCQVLQLLPFSSLRKRMSVVVSAPPLPLRPAATQGTRSHSGEPNVGSLCSGSMDWERCGNASHDGSVAGEVRGHGPLMPVRVLTKGAAELVLERCAWQLGGPDGTTLLPLTTDQRWKLLTSFADQGGGSLRLLALAYRDMLVPMRDTTPPTAAPTPAAAAPANATDGIVGGAASYGRAGAVDTANGFGGSAATLSLDAESLEKDLVLVGLLGLEDPLRPEVPAAVAACQRAGITVRMVTGDNVTTAASIAQQAGILPPEVDVRALVAAGPAAAAAAVTAATSKAARNPPTAAAVVGATIRADALAASPSLDTVTSTAPSTLSADVVTSPVDQLPYLVLEGATFRQLVLQDSGRTGGAGDSAAAGVDMAAFLALWPRLRVLARCSPGDKFVVVSALRKLREEGRAEEVVAVTGDGTNDAPALTAADVGFCMVSGTPIAREAADILLLDSSFTSIVSAVAWGRNVYASVTRFLQFQLTANVVAVAVAAGGAVWLRYSPLSAVQMLWVNLIMDSLASLALATEAPNEAMLDASPNRPHDPLVTPTVLKHIIGQSAFQLAVLYGMLAALQQYSGSAAAVSPAGGVLDSILASLFGGGGGGGGQHHLLEMTLVFNAFVQMQLFNQFNCRRVRDEVNILEGLAAHPLFLAIVGGEAVLQYVIVQYGGEAFNTTPLTAAQWALCCGLGAATLLVRGLLRGINVGAGAGAEGRCIDTGGG